MGCPAGAGVWTTAFPPPPHASSAAPKPHNITTARKLLDPKRFPTRTNTDSLNSWMSENLGVFAAKTHATSLLCMVFILLLIKVESKLRVIVGAPNMDWDDLAFLFLLEDRIHYFQKQ